MLAAPRRPLVPEGAALVGPRYVAGFACIGGACEDSCCSAGWGIPISRHDHDRLRAALDDAPDGARAFAAGVLPVPAPDASDATFALLRRDAAGRCTFLEADGLCGVQRAHGADTLNDTCTDFPRSTRQLGDRFELVLALSCPEAARRSLLVDGAMELVPLARALASRAPAGMPLAQPGAPAWEHALEPLRAALLAPLADTRLPVAVRLVLVTAVAQAVAPEVHARAATIDRAALDDTCAAIHDPDARAALAADAAAMAEDVPADRALLGVIAFLHGRLGHGLQPKFLTLVQGALATLGASAEAETPPTAATLLHALDQRRKAWHAALGPRLDRAVANMAMNVVLKEPVVRWPDPVAYVTELMLRIATFRVLLVGHPALDARYRADRAGGPPLGPEDAGLLDACIVEVAYLLGRYLEHNRHLPALVRETVAAHALDTPELLAALCVL
ncbi:MAG: flagellin lysine-N-methylase [Gemmatimonadales bacterium]|nr:flagellin lysine-N-methylase [Gemmatimonadales bacterium]